jgi:hypothetical protein
MNNEQTTPETDAASMTWYGNKDAVQGDFARKLERERDEARTHADNYAKQIKMMLQHDAERLESDSLVASCDCLTKTHEVKYHKPGCKYRLISERDEARESKDRISKRAEAIRCELVKAERERDELREALSGRTVSCSQCNESAAKLSTVKEWVDYLEAQIQ